MNIAIIVFSPSGNTLKVANMMETKLKNESHKVQLINITRDKNYFNKDNPMEYINNKIIYHDILMVGGPVQCHHLQYTLLNLIKALPIPDDKWGKYAIPFVTYGEISSGQSLKESAALLKKSGRIPIAGMKINSFHTISRQTKEKINEGMPGDEALPIIDELVTRISNIDYSLSDSKLDISKYLNFQNLKSKIIDALIYKEKILYPRTFPKVEFINEKCLKCGKCIKNCSVQCLTLDKNGPRFINDSNDCIHCDECYQICPDKAAKHDLSNFEKYLIDSTNGIGMAPSHEKPKSTLIPLNNLKYNLENN